MGIYARRRKYTAAAAEVRYCEFSYRDSDVSSGIGTRIGSNCPLLRLESLRGCSKDCMSLLDFVGIELRRPKVSSSVGKQI